MKITTMLGRLTACCLLAVFSCMAQAQSANDYPAKSVRIIVPFGPGGATDTVARMLADSFRKQFNESFLVENRPGASTQIGVESVARAAPDGYSLLITANNVAQEEVLNRQWPVRIERDLTTIAMVTRSGLSIIVNPDLPVHNLKELAAHSKANPGKLNQGVAVTPGASVEEVKARLGIQSVDVAYKGGPAMLQAIVSGEVHFSSGSPQDVAPLIRAGKVRAIAYLERERHPLLPDVPTVAESGVGMDDFDAATWFALMAPAGTPAMITAKLHQAVEASLKEPEMLDRIQKLGMQPFPATQAESRARVLAEVKINQERLRNGIVKQR